MLYRRVYLENRTPLQDSGQRVTDINLRDPITAFWIQFRATNGAIDNLANLLADCVTGIEVIDGAKVLYSLDGAEALALACYQLGRVPSQLVTELPGVTQSLAVPLMFGRYEGDTELAFDPTKFVNPQVRITWNLAAIRAVGVLGFVTLSMAVSVVAIVMEGAPAPRAMLMHKEHYSYVTAAGIEYVDLPTDYPYRGMLYRADLAARNLPAVVSNLRVTCDAGKYLPLDMRTTDLIAQLSNTHEKFSYQHLFHPVNGTTCFMIMKYLEDVALTCQNANDITYRYTNLAVGEGVLNQWIAGVADVNATNMYAMVRGYSPFRTVYIPFGRQDTPGDWFPVGTFRSVRLEATGAIAAANAFVCLSQEYPY